jgi:hypothetical protein
MHKLLVKVIVGVLLFLLAMVGYSGSGPMRISSQAETIVTLEWIATSLLADSDYQSVLVELGDEFAIDAEMALMRYPGHPLRVKRDDNGYLADSWGQPIRVDRSERLTIWSLGADGKDSRGLQDDLVAGHGVRWGYYHRSLGRESMYAIVIIPVTVVAIVHLASLRRSERRRLAWAIKSSILFLLVTFLCIVFSFVFFACAKTTSQLELAGLSVFAIGGSFALSVAACFIIEAVYLWRYYFTSASCLCCGYPVEMLVQCPECGLSTKDGGRRVQS